MYACVCVCVCVCVYKCMCMYTCEQTSVCVTDQHRARQRSAKNKLLEAHCYGIDRTGQIVEQSRSNSIVTDEDLCGRNVYISICSLTAT